MSDVLGLFALSSVWSPWLYGLALLIGVIIGRFFVVCVGHPMIRLVRARREQPAAVDTVNVPFTTPEWANYLAPEDYEFFAAQGIADVAKYNDVLWDEALAEDREWEHQNNPDRAFIDHHGTCTAEEWAWETERREKALRGITITPFEEWKAERRAAAGLIQGAPSLVDAVEEINDQLRKADPYKTVLNMNDSDMFL